MGNTALRLVTDSKKMLGNAPARLDGVDIGHGFHYWDGASGKRYLHSVYSLIDCPELPMTNYIIVRRNANGERIPVYIGQTKADASSLDLAFIRQTAARFKAKEVHIHVMTDSREERLGVERDLLRGQFAALESKLHDQAANSQH
jgi:hypothetical protein